MAAEQPYRVTREIPFAEINWQCIQDRLQEKFHLSPQSAAASIKSFSRRFCRSLTLYWPLHEKLSIDDERILTLVCQHIGADEVIMTYTRTRGLAGLNFGFSHRVKFMPTLKLNSSAETGSCFALYHVSFLGRTREVSKPLSLILLHSLIVLIGILVSVIGLGCLLYATAVFLYFLISPGETTVAATNNGLIGLALLTFLVGGAALGRNIILRLFFILRSRSQGGSESDSEDSSLASLFHSKY